MKKSLLLCVILLSGCASVQPLTTEFPDSSEYLMEVCPKLETIDKPEVVLSEFMKVITKNYTKYHECANKVNAWQEWYNKQKSISDKAKP